MFTKPGNLYISSFFENRLVNNSTNSDSLVSKAWFGEHISWQLFTFYPQTKWLIKYYFDYNKKCLKKFYTFSLQNMVSLGCLFKAQTTGMDKCK